MDYIIDANRKPYGRVASEAAVLLQGKKSASYAQNRVSDDKVIIKNADKVIATGGNKMTAKTYYRHTGYMGHMKELTLEQMLAKSPEKLIRQAIRKMLPQNSLNKKRLTRLVFEHGTKEN